MISSALLGMAAFGVLGDKVKTRATSDYLAAHTGMVKLANGMNPTEQNATDYLDGLRFDREAAIVNGDTKTADRLLEQVTVAQTLVKHFKHFAKQDGDGDTISVKDIKSVAGLDGNAKNVSAKDLK